MLGELVPAISLPIGDVTPGWEGRKMGLTSGSGERETTGRYLAETLGSWRIPQDRPREHEASLDATGP